jgi:hypothetical protein
MISKDYQALYAYIKNDGEAVGLVDYYTPMTAGTDIVWTEPKRHPCKIDLQGIGSERYINVWAHGIAFFNTHKQSIDDVSELNYFLLQCERLNLEIFLINNQKQSARFDPIACLPELNPVVLSSICPSSIGGNIDPDFEDALDRIRKWPISENYKPLFDYIISNAWKHDFGKATAYDDEYGQIEYTFVTGGWSENEEIISALKEQRLAWALTWQRSERGGKHVFVAKA